MNAPPDPKRALRAEAPQGNVSRLEARSEIYLSTLRSYIEALGGRLEITAVFGEERVPVAVDLSRDE